MPGELRVANLSRTADDRNLESLFAPYGTVRRARVVTDPTTWLHNTGVGRVEMSTDAEAAAAIAAMNGKLYCGAALEVGWAVPTLQAVVDVAMAANGAADTATAAAGCAADAAHVAEKTTEQAHEAEVAVSRLVKA